jgi:hypothetical protein
MHRNLSAFWVECRPGEQNSKVKERTRLQNVDFGSRDTFVPTLSCRR